MIEANDVTRIPPGHPEGYLERFANIYSDVSKVLFAKINKENCKINGEKL